MGSVRRPPIPEALMDPEPPTNEPALLVATDSRVLRLEPGGSGVVEGGGLEGHRPTCLAAAPGDPLRAWCGTVRGGVFRTEDGGASWEPSGLDGKHIMSLAASPVRDQLLWAGSEPSALFRSDDGGTSWRKCRDLTELSSSSEWAFPPRPETHHVRWIACHPFDADRLWLAIEAGALVTTGDGGASWRDRVSDGPRDTHELAVHPQRPLGLRVAAGDGYFESDDGGATWRTPAEGLEVGYLRSVALDPGDPDTVVASASSGPRSAYVAGYADGRLYRREKDGAWERVRAGWPDPPSTIAALLRPGRRAGEFWAADERGVHRSDDGGRRWERVARYGETPSHLRGFELLTGAE